MKKMNFLQYNDLKQTNAKIAVKQIVTYIIIWWQVCAELWFEGKRGVGILMYYYKYSIWSS